MTLPAPEQAALTLVSYLVHQIVEGKEAPRELLSRFWSECYMHSRYGPLGHYLDENCGCRELERLYYADEELEMETPAGRLHNEQVQAIEITAWAACWIRAHHSQRIESNWLLWNQSLVVRLAKGIREEHRYGSLPILGDALEEAGCDNHDLLNHCRQPSEHVRGCWVVDLVLGKS
jgi:hypothetical protein